MNTTATTPAQKSTVTIDLGLSLLKHEAAASNTVEAINASLAAIIGGELGAIVTPQASVSNC